MTHSNAYVPMAEVDAIVAFFGRKVGHLRVALAETDQLARAGETVGYESSYRILRRAVAEVLEEPCPGCDRHGRGIRQQPDGALLCSVCGRTVVSAEQAAGETDVP